jgi:hypothetical protein
MSNTPGIHPLKPDLEDIRQSEDPIFDKDDQEPSDEETDEEAADRIGRETIDLA